MPLYGLKRRFVETRKKPATDRKDVNERSYRVTDPPWEGLLEPVHNALIGKRDVRLCQELDKCLRDDKPGRRIAVLYGAGHIPAVLRHLDQRGFVIREAEWMDMIRL